MKQSFIKVFVAGFILLFSFYLNAQERVIHGRITTLDSIPLMFVKIEVGSTKQVIKSDSLGYFTVNCSLKDKLIVSAKGFYDHKMKLTGDISYAAVNLKPKTGKKNLEDSFIYLNKPNREVLRTHSLQNGDPDFSNYQTIYELIPGRIVGVNVINGEFFMRGSRSISGSDAAMILVDGVRTDSRSLSMVSPSNVKSVTVLRGSKAAPYGSEGANGIIAIETKRGTKK